MTIPPQSTAGRSDASSPESPASSDSSSVGVVVAGFGSGLAPVSSTAFTMRRCAAEYFGLQVVSVIWALNVPEGAPSGPTSGSGTYTYTLQENPFVVEPTEV